MISWLESAMAIVTHEWAVVPACSTTLVISLQASGIACMRSAAMTDMSWSLGEVGMGRWVELQSKQELKWLELCYKMDSSMGWDQSQRVLWWASAADWSWGENREDWDTKVPQSLTARSAPQPPSLHA